MSDRFGPSLDCPDCGETYSAGEVHHCTIPTKQCETCWDVVKETQLKNCTTCGRNMCSNCKAATTVDTCTGCAAGMYE